MSSLRLVSAATPDVGTSLRLFRWPGHGPLCDTEDVPDGRASVRSHGPRGGLYGSPVRWPPQAWTEGSAVRLAPAKGLSGDGAGCVPDNRPLALLPLTRKRPGSHGFKGDARRVGHIRTRSWEPAPAALRAREGDVTLCHRRGPRTPRQRWPSLTEAANVGRALTCTLSLDSPTLFD